MIIVGKETPYAMRDNVVGREPNAGEETLVPAYM